MTKDRTITRDRQTEKTVIVTINHRRITDTLSEAKKRTEATRQREQSGTAERISKNGSSKTPAKAALKAPAKPQNKQQNKPQSRSTGKRGRKGAARLKIIPLGGLEQIGMNITAFEYGDSIVVVDCGLSFPEDDMLGIDLVIPDVTYLKENISKVKGLCDHART